MRHAQARRADDLEPRQLVVGHHGGRRMTILGVVAAVAATVIVAAAVTAVVRAGQEGTRPGAGATPATMGTPAPEGMRSVSFADVEVDVPDTWIDDDPPRSDWCADGAQFTGPDQPYVALDAGEVMVAAIACPDAANPPGFPEEPVSTWAPHLWFEQSSGGVDGTETFAGWTLTTRTVGEVTVRLLTDEATADDVERIVGSVRRVSVDAAGCEPTSAAQAREFVRPPAFDVTTVQATEISVCSYTRTGTEQPGLLGSHVLTGDDASDVLAALQQAPAGGGPNRPGNCSPDYTGTSVLVLRLRDGPAAVGDLIVYSDSCYGNGADDGTTVRALTLDSCAPLWGGRVTWPGGDGTTLRVCHPRR
ncbi:hypothetical protein [Nocardioides marinquilinus]